ALGELAAALDPVLASTLGEVSGIELAATPAIDLTSAQLAIDCVGETADCLRATAQQTGTAGLLAPSVRRDAESTTVTLLYYQTGDAPIRRAERRYSGERQGQQALEGARGMLEELFPAPAPPPIAAGEPAPEPAPAAAIPPPTTATAPRSSARGVPILPVILGGVGVALLGTSVAFGVMAKSTEDAYSKLDLEDEPDTEEALEKLDAAQTQATVCNVTLGLGIGALVAGGVLLFWQLKERGKEDRAQLTPSVGPGQVGLTLTAAWDGGR
ncbi:MAG TPA: hypothetical protein VJR89_00530, partial [Polyangiales bacterium]|nr:hypothetical protein [Polyangiales bacterium]